MKKILAFFTAVCLLLINVQVFAKDTVVTDEKTVEILFEMGIVKGDVSGDLRPESFITRAEFATILTRVLFEEQYVQNRFSDTVNHWAVNNVNLMAEKNIVAGYGNGKFGPDDNVTLAQAVKILVNLLGYGETDFTYPQDYILQAAKLSLTKDVVKKPDDYVSRNDAAGLILNALYVPYADGSGAMVKEIGKAIYFVSPGGSDDNDGSYDKPWKTLEKAVQAVSGSAIVSVEEGTYNISEALTFANSGSSAGEPLVFRAKPGAAVNVVFEKSVTPAITVTGNYITIENIAFSQVKTGAAGDDPFVAVNGSGAVIKNNVFDNIENVISLQSAENALITGNAFYSGANALLIDGGKDISVKNNKIENQSESYITAFGNVSNVSISNNSLLLSNSVINGGVVLGKENTGVSKCAVWNNVIYAKEAAGAAGILLNGVTDLCFYNNIVDGVSSCAEFGSQNKNILFRNNVFMNTKNDAFVYRATPAGFDSNYNCFYGTYPQIMETNSIFSNPYFVSEGDDWRLMNGSELAGSGAVMPDKFLCSDGSVMLLDNSDFNGQSRTDSWHMGIYATLSGDEIVLEEGEAAQEVLLLLDFKKGADHFINSADGEWKVSNGTYWQEKADTGRTTSVYDGGLEWADYEVSADVEASNTTEGNATGLIFRADKEMKNMYAIRFLSNNSLEFVKWTNNTFLSIQRWSYTYKPDTVYNLKVKAENNEFTFYINGEKLGTVEEDSFSKGTVGFYCFREVNKYDNLKVVSID